MTETTPLCGEAYQSHSRVSTGVTLRGWWGGVKLTRLVSDSSPRKAFAPVRLATSFPASPEVLALPDRAFRVYIGALCWAVEHETDGRLPASAMQEWCKGVLRRQDAIRALERDLWERTEEGWVIRHYSRYQYTRAEVESRRNAGAERVRRHRNRQPPHPGQATNVTPLQPVDNREVETTYPQSVTPLQPGM